MYNCKNLLPITSQADTYTCGLYYNHKRGPNGSDYVSIIGQ